MANKFAVGDTWESALSWSATSGGAGGAGIPADFDSIYFDANSITMDAGEILTGSFTLLDMTGFTGGLCSCGDVTIDVDGPATLSGQLGALGFMLTITVTGNIEVLAGTTFYPSLVTIEHNDTAANTRTIKTRGLTGNVIFKVNNAGITSLTATEDAGTTISWKSFERVTNGKYAGGAFAHNVGGTIDIYANGVFSDTGKWTQTANGNIRNGLGANAFAELSRNAEVVSTLVGFTYVKKLSGAGTIALVAQTLLFPSAITSDFYTATCAYTRTSGEINIVRATANISNAAAMDFGTMPVTILVATAGVKTLTVGGRFTCGTLIVKGDASSNLNSLIANGGLAASGLVTLGEAATARAGGLSLAGACVLGDGLAAAGTATNHELNLNSAYVFLTGTIDGVNVAGGAIVPTNVAARIQGGTAADLDCSGTNELTCFGTVDGTGNTNVTFDKHAPPGSLTLMGVGT